MASLFGKNDNGDDLEDRKCMSSQLRSLNEYSIMSSRHHVHQRPHHSADPPHPFHGDADLSLLHLPDELIVNILSFLTYEEISEMRRVCTRFNSICKMLLNNGFDKVNKFHSHCQKHVKSQLPRRESERRNHPLARHSDILGAVETRLSLLSMTFMKYVDMDSCCFIPGKVIDEMFRVLHFVKTSPSPPRAHELLQELRDISSMAMEHFDEKIVPELKKHFSNQLVSTTIVTTRDGSHNITPVVHMSGQPFSSLSVSAPPGRLTFPAHAKSRLPSIRQDITKLQRQLRITNKTAMSARKSVAEYRKQRANQRKRSVMVERQMVQQSRLIREQNQKLTDQEKRIDELNRKVLEYDQKFVDLYAELSHVRDAQLDAVSPRNKGSLKAGANDSSQNKGTASKIDTAAIAGNAEDPLEGSSQQNVKQDLALPAKRITRSKRSADTSIEDNQSCYKKRGKRIKPSKSC